MATDLEQVHFRFRTDGDAADATPTWGANEDANFDPGASAFRLRLGLANIGDASSGSLALYLQKNVGSYAAITTASTGGVKSYDASSDADDTPIRVPRLSMSVEWQLAGAAIDLDFANNRIYPSGAFTDFLSCSRASTGYAKNSSGTWVEFASNVLRITDLGFLIEESRTNYLLNSGSPATQTTESLGTGSYCLWLEGSGSAIATGGTATITGAATVTDGSPNTFSVTVAGTVVVTVTGTPDRFQLENDLRGTGSFPSSYIPTTSASATRATDLIVTTNALDTAIKTLPQTVLVDVKFAKNPTWYWGVIGYQDGVPIMTNIDGGATNKAMISDNSVNNLICTFGNSLTWADGVKVGSCQDTNGRSIVGGGGTVAGDAYYGVNQGSIRLGDKGTERMYGYFRRLTVWSSRLSDATLQALTAP